MKKFFNIIKHIVVYKYKVVKCPVCGKLTLNNNYICSNCKWEYDGTVGNEYSFCNDSTIEEYKNEMTAQN